MFGRSIPSRQILRSLQFGVVAGVLALNTLTVSSAVAQVPQGVQVILTEYKFSPSTITLTVGQPVQLSIINQGLGDHNLSSRDDPDSIPVSNVTYQKADNDPGQLKQYQAASIFDADANSGHTSVVTFTPTKVGTFKFISNAGDDEINGMVGTFVVVGLGGQTAPAPAAAAAPAPAPAPAAGSLVARDGQSLSSQSASTQAMFNAVWGAQAAQEWVTEHNAALPR